MRVLLKKRMDTLGSLMRFLKPRKKEIVQIFIGKILVVILGLLGLMFNKFIIDDVLLGKQIKLLIWICIGIIGVYLIETLIMVILKNLENKVYYKVTFLVKAKLWRYLVQQQTEFYDEHDVGDLKNRIDNDMQAIESFLPEQIIQYLFESITAIAIVGIIIFMNWKLAVFGLIMLPLVFFVTTIMGKGVTKAVENYRTIWGEYEGWIVSDVRGWKEVKALNIQKKEQIKFVEYWRVLCAYNFRKWIYWFANINFIIIKDTFIINLSIYFIGAILIFNGQITVGSLLVFKIYYEKMMASINKINELDMKFSNDLPAIKRVTEMLGKTFYREEDKIEYKDAKGDIHLENVSYKYKGKDEYSLFDINIDVKEGEKIAVVGRSGCGKSTLIKLLAGLYKSNKGTIKIDGIDMNHIKIEALHNCIGVVMQDNILFNMTIEENLKLAKPSATMNEMIEACENACILEIINKLPSGFNTIIGEGGSKLSGGQRQRLSIARVMLRKPKIIIFDEATSALDYQSEKVINEAIDKLSGDSTVIVIAHRLSSLLSMERVIVLEGGRVVGDGTHKSLLEDNVPYQKLFGSQYELKQTKIKNE